PRLGAARIAPMTAVAQVFPRIDRRLDERRDCLTGLARWLESARRLLKVDALALADPSGCLVAGAGSIRRCEEMAALAPLDQTASSQGRTGMMVASRLGEAWLCAPVSEPPVEYWQAVRAGCLRILGWTEPG
ncbi:MAG TPA: hypothetical protein VKP30_30930, partial [Polyangiaceae bacterium]|nr:hypothetical protein [Polyangiaceae bacterium]